MAYMECLGVFCFNLRSPVLEPRPIWNGISQSEASPGLGISRCDMHVDLGLPGIYVVPLQIYQISPVVYLEILWSVVSLGRYVGSRFFADMENHGPGPGISFLSGWS